MKISIIKYQRDKIKTEITQNILKKGIIPTDNEIYKRTEAYFSAIIPGMPFFKPIYIEPHSLSNATVYNNMYKNLMYDLDLMYYTNNQQIAKLLTMEEYYNIEKEKLVSDITNLSLRCDNIVDSLNINKNTQCAVLNFDNFYDIDFIGDNKRNIPATNAYIDLAEKKVSNLKISRASDKVDLYNSETTITINGKYLSTEEYGSKNSFLSDFENEMYNFKVISQNNTSISLDVLIKLPVEKDINSLIFNFTSLNEMTVLLRLSRDGKNYTEYNEQSSKDCLEWNFATTTVKYINLLLTKNEADGKGNSFEYYFILKNLSAFKEMYEQNGLLVTNPVLLNNIVNSVQFIPYDTIYPATQINYFIGIDNFKDKIDWTYIQDNNVLDINLLNKRRNILNNSIDSFGKTYETYSNVYRLCNVDKYINENTLKLFFGFNMWKVEEFSVKDKIDEKYIPSFNDYNIDNLNNVYYIDNDFYKLNASYNTVLFLSQYVYCDKEEYVNNLYIKVKDSLNKDMTNLKIVIYLNNNKITTINDLFSAYLKKGKNKITIAIAIQDTPSPLISILHNINFENKDNIVCAESKMKFTDFYSLTYSTLDNNKAYYAIDNDTIIIKHNPLSTSYSDYINGIRYLLEYSYLSNDKKDMVVLNGDIPNVYVRVMAQLSSTSDDYSPKISNIRLIGV